MIVLYPASPKNGDITHYYVIVVPDERTHGRRPDDFKIDEVSAAFLARVACNSVAWRYRDRGVAWSVCVCWAQDRELRKKG